MKALTITQPWATLVAIGVKRIETRSWRTSYRGPIAIHAAGNFPGWARVLCTQLPYRTALLAAGYRKDTMLPRGAVIATAVLIDCVAVEQLDREPLAFTGSERRFGDYTLGQYGWRLSCVRPLPVPSPTTGALGLWEWRHEEGRN